MKAIICTRYGPPDVLQLQDVEKPSPKNDEVLIKVYAASVNARDRRLMRADPFLVRLTVGGLLKPKTPILGADMAGRVEAVGSNVRQFQPGDDVFGYLSRYCGRTFADYVCAGENEIALKPANLSFEQAAAVPLAAITALQGLRDKGNIQPGQKVLIQGASGGVGTFAVQIAKSFGAQVTAVVRQYDKAATPYQRLVASGTLDQVTWPRLREVYSDLNPARLRRQLQTMQERVWDASTEVMALVRSQMTYRPPPG